MLRHIETNNDPLVTYTKAGLQAVLDGVCEGYIGCAARFVPHLLNYNDSTEFTEIDGAKFIDDDFGGHYFFDKRIVDAATWVSGFNKAWFDQPIEGKAVYVCKTGSSEMMTHNPVLYVIEEKPDPSFYEVQHSAQTIGELVFGNYKFRFDEAQKVFVELDEISATKNLYRALIRCEILKVAGDVHSRLADYARLIAVLVQHANLPPELTDAMADIMTVEVNADQLSGINRRESKVQAIINSYKNGEVPWQTS